MNIAGNITQLVGKTPLVDISDLADRKVRLLGKLESFNPCSSVKDRIAVHMKGLIGELFSQRSICEQIAKTSFYIDPTIGFGSACPVTDLVKFIFSPGEMQSKFFEHIAALLEGHFAEYRASGFSTIF